MIVCNQLLSTMRLLAAFSFLLSGATFGLEKDSCRVMEDVTFRVCVVLKSSHEDCPVEFEFNLNLSVSGELLSICNCFVVSPSPLLPTASRDHTGTTTNITFKDCSRRVCKNVTVIDDMSLERDEIFSISLSTLSNHDSRIQLSGVRKDVTIQDTDSKAPPCTLSLCY